jgi:putative ABC transport system substrate-binding protein
VTSGLVKSIARPEGNLTGVSLFYGKLLAKRLEILHQLVPSAEKIGYLTDPSYPNQAFDDLLAAGKSLGLRITILDARNAGELDAAFAKVKSERLDALLLASVPLSVTIPFRDGVIALAAQNRIPVGYAEREQVAAGGS